MRHGYAAHIWAGGYITRALLGVPSANRGDNNEKWRLAPHVGNQATSPLPSWGSAPQSEGTTMTNGYVVHVCAGG